MKTKLSANQRRVLLNRISGLPIYHHCRGRSGYGGLARTVESLRRHGLLDQNNDITELGRDALRAANMGISA